MIAVHDLVRVDSPEKLAAWIGSEGGRLHLVEQDGRPGRVLLWRGADELWHVARTLNEGDLGWWVLPDGVRQTAAVPVDVVFGTKPDSVAFTVLRSEGQSCVLADVPLSWPGRRGLASRAHR